MLYTSTLQISRMMMYTMKSDSEFCLNRIYPPDYFFIVHINKGKGQHARNTLFFSSRRARLPFDLEALQQGFFILKHKHMRLEPPKVCIVLNTLGETVSVMSLKSICTPERCKVLSQESVHVFSQFWPFQGLFGQTHHLSSLVSNLATCL